MIARQVVLMIRQAGISKSDLLILRLQTVFLPFGEPDPRLILLEGKHRAYFVHHTTQLESTLLWPGTWPENKLSTLDRPCRPFV